MVNNKPPLQVVWPVEPVDLGTPSLIVLLTCITYCTLLVATGRATWPAAEHGSATSHENLGHGATQHFTVDNHC